MPKKTIVPAEIEVKDTVSAVSPAPVEEPKKEPAKRGRKPAAEKKSAAKGAAKKNAAAKTTAAAVSDVSETKKESAKRGRPSSKKGAVSKTAKKTASAKKPAAKKGSSAKAAETSAKRSYNRKSKFISYEDIVAAAGKKFRAANITKIKYSIAANVELSGNFVEKQNDDSNKNVFYIFIDPEKQEISVEPYKYNDYDVTISADADELMKVLNGKKNIYDAISGNDFHVHGNNITKAILLINAAF